MKKVNSRGLVSILLILLLIVISTLAFSSAFAEEKGVALDPLELNMKVTMFLDQSKLHVEAQLFLKKNQLTENQFVFHLDESLKVINVGAVDEEILEYGREGTQLSIKIPEKTDAFPFELNIEYEGKLDSGGLASISPQGCYLSWIFNWYPFGDTFHGLTGRNTFIVSDNLMVASQGKLLEDKSAGDNREIVYQVTRPSYYTIAGGPFEYNTETFNDIDFRTYFLAGGKEKSNFYIANSKKIIDALSQRFGDYPYDHFNLVELPKLPGVRVVGSSEQGMVVLPPRTVKGDYFNYPIIAHEIGHMWWGNWTIGDTFVMSEGLAQLGNYLAMEAIYSEKIMRNYALYGSIDHFSSVLLYLTRFAESNNDEPNFETMEFGYEDYIVMQGKGPAVFLMLRDLIGKKAFYSGFANATAKYAHTRMTMDQLQSEFEMASDTDLDWFFEQWTDRPGAPVLSLQWSVENREGNHLVTGQVKQTREPFYTLPIELVAKSAETEKTIKIDISGESTPFSFSSVFEPRSIEMDPEKKSLWIGVRERERGSFSEAMRFGKKKDESISILEGLIDSNPDDHLARMWLAFEDSHFRGNTPKTIQQLRYVTENADPVGEYELYYSRACFELAKIYEDSGNTVEAIELYNRILKHDRTGRFQKAVENRLKILVQ